MKHKIEIRNRGQHVLTITNTDTADLALSACAKMLGMSISYMSVYVDGEYLKMNSGDIAHIRFDMETIMRRNEKGLDFGIDGLFEV